MTEPAERVIVVTGEGVAAGSPDLCDLALGLQSRSGTPGGALDAVSSAAAAALAAVKGIGVPDADLQTSGLAVQELTQPGRPDTDGYVAHYSLAVIGRPVNAAGEILSVAASAGGIALRVNGIRLRFSDPRPLRREARRRAIEDARERAEDMAAAAGVRLGAVIRIDDAPARPLAQPVRAFAASASGPLPIEVGLGGIAATATVTFAIDE